MGVSAQLQANSLFLCLFVLVRPSTDGIMPTHTGAGHFFTQSTDLNANLFWKRSYRNYVLQLSGHLLA